MYVRGSDEQVLARAAGLVEQLPKLKPASVEAVDEIESLLGSPLPHVLRRMYLELGNGGFGPGYGVLGVTGGHMDDMKMTATDIRRHGDFPPNLMAICNWGCAIYSLVEPGADGRIWGYDPNPVEDYEQALFPQSFDLREWFSRWLVDD